MGTLEPVLESFDRDNNVRHHETHHRQRIFLHEVSKIVRCVQEFSMFEKTPIDLIHHFLTLSTYSQIISGQLKRMDSNTFTRVIL